MARDKRIRSAFDKGTVPAAGKVLVDKEAVPAVENNLVDKEAVPAVENILVERKNIIQEVKSIIRPLGFTDSYDLIIGNHGTGKTTIVCQIGHEQHGIIYVDVPEDATFEDAFIDALRWTPPVFTWWETLLEKIFNVKELRKGKIYRLY